MTSLERERRLADGGEPRDFAVTMAMFSMDAVSNRNNAGGRDSFGDGGGRTKVMDGSWNPRRVNCWPLYVRLGDTLALPRPRKSMHPFVLSRALLTPLASRTPFSTYTTIYTATNVAMANSYSLTTLSLSRDSGGSLFFTPQKGELGGVGDVRLLHYVFLTEPPLTSTLFPPRRSSSHPSFPFHPLFTFLSWCPLPFRVSPLNKFFPLLKSSFSSHEPTFLLITRSVGVGREVGIATELIPILIGSRLVLCNEE